MSVQQSARVSSPGARLGNGDVFPSLRVAAVGGGTFSLPDDLAGSFGVVLFYRGRGALTATRSSRRFTGRRANWPRWG